MISGCYMILFRIHVFILVFFFLQAFGVSVFEEEDEDIYGTEDLTNYDFTLEPEAEKKKIKKQEYPQLDCIEGFHICAKPYQRKERFPQPQIPAGKKTSEQLETRLAE